MNVEGRSPTQLAFRRFYSRPSFLVRRFCALRTPSDAKAAVRGIKSLFWLWADRTVFFVGRPKAVNEAE